MRIISFDPASVTGWALLEDDKLINCGSIHLPSQLTLPQRLNLLHLEICKVMDSNPADYCAVEEPPLAISGVKVLIYLSRINGVVIQSTFNYLKDRVYLFEPTTWKANSLPSLEGMSPKWKIQIEACRYFGIDANIDYDSVDSQINSILFRVDQATDETTCIKNEINKIKARLKHKRNVPSKEEKGELLNKLKELEKSHSSSKNRVKSEKTLVNRELQKIGNDILSQTGMSSDVADAAVMGLCLYRQLTG